MQPVGSRNPLPQTVNTSISASMPPLNLPSDEEALALYRAMPNNGKAYTRRGTEAADLFLLHGSILSEKSEVENEVIELNTTLAFLNVQLLRMNMKVHEVLENAAFRAVCGLSAVHSKNWGAVVYHLVSDPPPSSISCYN